MNNRLTPLQQEFLAAFFRHDNRFYLTGGAALVGFHLGHRVTHDLDLFALEDDLENGSRIVTAAARELGAEIEALQTSPEFRRLLIRRRTEAVVVDLIRERGVQLIREKPIINGIRVDPPEEILANKLCALLSRSEIRDLVDVRQLELAGHHVEDALAAAAAKDSGLTPAQLAWVLSEIVMGNDLIPPGDVALKDLRLYQEALTIRLTRLAFPS